MLFHQKKVILMIE